MVRALLLFQRGPEFQFPAPITPAPGNLKPFSGLSRHLNVHTNAHMIVHVNVTHKC